MFQIFLRHTSNEVCSLARGNLRRDLPCLEKWPLGPGALLLRPRRSAIGPADSSCQRTPRVGVFGAREDYSRKSPEGKGVACVVCGQHFVSAVSMYDLRCVSLHSNTENNECLETLRVNYLISPLFLEAFPKTRVFSRMISWVSYAMCPCFQVYSPMGLVVTTVSPAVGNI